MLPFKSLRPPDLSLERKSCKGLISETLNIDLTWSNGFNQLNSKTDNVMLRYANWLPGTFKGGSSTPGAMSSSNPFNALVEHLVKF